MAIHVKKLTGKGGGIIIDELIMEGVPKHADPQIKGDSSSTIVSYNPEVPNAHITVSYKAYQREGGPTPFSGTVSLNPTNRSHHEHRNHVAHSELDLDITYNPSNGSCTVSVHSSDGGGPDSAPYVHLHLDATFYLEPYIIKKTTYN